MYDEETQDALEASGGDEEFAAFDENHSFIIPEGCHWSDLRNASKDVGKIYSDFLNYLLDMKAIRETLGTD